MFISLNHKKLASTLLALGTLGVISEHLSAATLSQPWQIVVDAGSSKTRGILYERSPDTIKPIAEYTVKEPLASYGDAPEGAGTKVTVPLLNALFSIAKEQGHSLDRARVQVSVLGTGGMRGLQAPQQQAIYNAVNQAVHDQGLSTGQVRSTEGWEQGVFAWAQLNGLKKLAGTDKTLGIIEIGDASSQITFASAEVTGPETHPVELLGKSYRVLSHSLTGLGANAARTAMDKANLNAQSCYPKGLSRSSGFDFTQCGDAYDKAVKTDFTAEMQKLDSIIHSGSYPKTEFVGLGALYHILNFFDADTPNPAALKTTITNTCSHYGNIEAITKDKAKDQYQPENKCANGVFVYNFLYDYLKLSDGQLHALKTVDSMDIRWTEGFLLLNPAR